MPLPIRLLAVLFRRLDLAEVLAVEMSGMFTVAETGGQLGRSHL